MQQSIIYFEDDLLLAKMLIEFLNSEGYQVFHFTRMPEGGIADLITTAKEPPFMVLMDVRLDHGNGFEICKTLKDDDFFHHSPVVFISGLIEEKDILQAYEAGAYDYLTKPVKLKSMQLKCRQIRENQQKTEALTSQISTTEQIAFEAMTTSSELGSILRFHEAIADLDSIDALAKLLVREVCSFGVSASVMFYSDKNPSLYHSDDGKTHQLEQEIFEMLKKQGRIYSWNNRTLFNYDTFSVLIRTMPIDDEGRYGTLKDQFCLLLNGVEGRVRGIINEKAVLRSEENIRIIGQTIGKMVLDMEENNLKLSEQFEKIISDLEVDVSADIAHLSLVESEEELLIGHIGKAIGDASLIFDETKRKESAYKKVMIELLTQLEK